MPSKTSRRWIPSAALGALALLALALGFARWSRSGEPTTLILVRHADREGATDALSAAGAARARELVHVGERLGLAAIYQSNTVRARDTASPLASALGLVPIERPAGDVQALVTEVLAEHRGQRVLIVGHGNTVPQIIAAAGGPVLPDIAHDEFDRLFVLTTGAGAGSPAQLTELAYGVVSP
jgi:broad specificity phosphatase PhoE